MSRKCSRPAMTLSSSKILQPPSSGLLLPFMQLVRHLVCTPLSLPYCLASSRNSLQPNFIPFALALCRPFRTVFAPTKRQNEEECSGTRLGGRTWHGSLETGANLAEFHLTSARACAAAEMELDIPAPVKPSCESGPNGTGIEWPTKPKY